MSDDEDYMSDKFLLESERNNTPKLARRVADQRELEVMKKKIEKQAQQKHKTKSTRVMEEESRAKGLISAISSDNKGFKLLEKMGYIAGQGIGKKEGGISEPITIDLKTNRLGLGRAPKLKQPSSRNTPKKEPVLNMDDFRCRAAQKRNERMIETDLRKSQMCCEHLDTQQNIMQPNEVWFWPVIKEKPESESDNDEDENEIEEKHVEPDMITSSEKLEIINKYLRDKYFYCIWCGTAYNDDEDLRDSCPGNTRDHH